MPGRRCEATTAAGVRCKNTTAVGEMYCRHHSEEADADRELKKLDVLDALAALYSYTAAAARAGISTVQLRWWREEDPEFATKCLIARGEALDRVETALIIRAIGYDEVEDVWANGKIVGTKKRRVFSDRAAELMLRSVRAEYRSDYDQQQAKAEVDPARETLREAMLDPTKADDIAALLDRLDG